MSERLEKAAQHLESLLKEQANEATEKELEEIHIIINTLRNSKRTDLEHANWASVFTCLHIWNHDLALTVSLILEEAKI